MNLFTARLTMMTLLAAATRSRSLIAGMDVG